MIEITEEIKNFISENLPWIVTKDQNGVLDIGPKMSTFVLDSNHLAYHERTGKQHYQNLLNGSDLVIGVANKQTKTGYRFRGKVALHSDDEIYKTQVQVAQDNGTKIPLTIPVLEVEVIEDLTAGPNAGEVIQSL